MENGYQHFTSRGNIVKVPLSMDNLGQPCIYWTDIEDCFPGVLRIQNGSTFVPVVRGVDGYRLKPHRIKHYPLKTLTVVYYDRSSARIERERERQPQSSSSPQSPTPLISKKLPDRQKKTKATPEASPTTSTTTPVSSSLAANIAAISALSLAEMAVWPPLFSGTTSSTSGSPVMLDPFGPNLYFSFPAVRARGTMGVKMPAQGSNPSTTTPATDTFTTILPESGDTKCPTAVAEVVIAPEEPIIPLTDRTIKTPVSPSRRSKKYRPRSISNSEDLAPEIQELILKDEQEDGMDTVTIPATTLESSFPESAPDMPMQEKEKETFTPASTLASAEEERHSTISRFFGLFL